MADLNIVEERQNPLFNRREIKLTLEADSIPSKDEVLKIVSEKLSIPLEKIVIKTLKGKFGSRVFDLNIRVYDSEEEKFKIEPKIKEKKK